MEEQRAAAGKALASLRKRVTLTCDGCGREFEGLAVVANGTRRYHSASCRSNAWQKRKRLAARTARDGADVEGEG